MTVKEVHIAIEQGLTTVGIFQNGDILHSEIDIAINSVVYNELRDIFKNIDLEQNANNFERNQYQSDFTSVLKITKDIPLTKSGGVYAAKLPASYLYGIASYSNVVSNRCSPVDLVGSDDVLLTVGAEYLTVTDVKIGDNWLKPKVAFVATEPEFYGTVTAINTVKTKNRLLRSEKITHDASSLFASTSKSPIAEIMGNTLLIYTNNKFDIANISLVYIRQFRKIDYDKGINLEFSDDILSFIIRKTVIYLGIETEQSQQKLVNLRTESI